MERECGRLGNFLVTTNCLCFTVLCESCSNLAIGYSFCSYREKKKLLSCHAHIDKLTNIMKNLKKWNFYIIF